MVNCRNVKWVTRIQVVITSSKLLALAIIVIIGFYYIFGQGDYTDIPGVKVFENQRNTYIYNYKNHSDTLVAPSLTHTQACAHALAHTHTYIYTHTQTHITKVSPLKQNSSEAALKSAY